MFDHDCNIKKKYFYTTQDTVRLRQTLPFLHIYHICCSEVSSSKGLSYAQYYNGHQNNIFRDLYWNTTVKLRRMTKMQYFCIRNILWDSVWVISTKIWICVLDKLFLCNYDYWCGPYGCYRFFMFWNTPYSKMATLLVIFCLLAN